MSDRQYYVNRSQDKQEGPFPLSHVQQLYASGQLRPEHLVWAEGFPNWMPAGEVPELVSGLPSAPPTAPGAIVAPPVGTGPESYAGFWKRFIAAFIDNLVLFVANLGVQFVAGALMGVGSPIAPNPQSPAYTGFACATGIIQLVMYWLYFALQESGSKQATLGKLAMNIIVTDEEGNRISFARATGRYFSKILSGLILLIGYIMAAFTAKKQALHDIIAKTLVIDKP